MSLQNGEIVAAEGRYDLPLLFCMVGRHGPAVAFLVALLLSVVGLFSAYRRLQTLVIYLRREVQRKHPPTGSVNAAPPHPPLASLSSLSVKVLRTSRWEARRPKVQAPDTN